jgi:hypothetical protein
MLTPQQHALFVSLKLAPKFSPLIAPTFTTTVNFTNDSGSTNLKSIHHLHYRQATKVELSGCAQRRATQLMNMADL